MTKKHKKNPLTSRLDALMKHVKKHDKDIKRLLKKKFCK